MGSGLSAFDRLEEGWVWRSGDANPGQAGGSRCAVASDGTLVCTYMSSSRLGVNDMCPMIAWSDDGGVTWRDHRLVWPALKERWSIAVNVSSDGDGGLYLFGIRWPIDEPGEPFWNSETGGLKQNDLVWSRAHDGGETWSDLRVIPMPFPGTAEAPGAMCVTRDGLWLCPYSPYPDFDGKAQVDRGRVIVMVSDDGGERWSHADMLRFPEPRTGSAEAWVVELADGRLLGAGWKMDLDDSRDYENPFALSRDGLIWEGTRSTGTLGQSVGLAATADGRVLMTYNQRKRGERGVWLALARPDEEGFGIEADEVVWRAQEATKGDSSGDHGEWTDFAFGEPAVTVLEDGILLIVFWVGQPGGSGVRYLRLRLAA